MTLVYSISFDYSMEEELKNAYYDNNNNNNTSSIRGFKKKLLKFVPQKV